jgi:hypothetical protein
MKEIMRKPSEIGLSGTLKVSPKGRHCHISPENSSATPTT